MGIQLLDENNVRSLPAEKRFLQCEKILKTEKDESKRWDAVWLIGELAEKKDSDDPMFQKVSDVLEWVLKNDDNGVVKHEAIESLGLMRAFEAEHLIQKAMDDPSIDVRETASFVLKRFARLRNSGAYNPSDIL